MTKKPVWINRGDVSPRQGTRIFDTASADFDQRGFEIECVDTVPESDVGGSDKVFLVRKGTAFLARENFASALQVIDCRLLENDLIEMPGADRHGNFETVGLHSAEGILTLADAVYAYGGIDNVDISVLVSIGLPDRIDQERKFPGETTYFRERGEPVGRHARAARRLRLRRTRNGSGGEGGGLRRGSDLRHAGGYP